MIRVRDVVRRWWRQVCCRHHWHPADPMIAWQCCHCGMERDGMPQDLTYLCAGDPLTRDGGADA